MSAGRDGVRGVVWRWVAALALTALLGVISWLRSMPAANASQFLGEPNLCKEPTHIFIGKVVANEAFQYADEMGSVRIYTRNYFHVDRLVLGPSVTEIEYVSEGGEFGGRGQITSGAPRFVLEKTYLVFLAELGTLLGPEYADETFRWMYYDHLLVPRDLPLPDEATLRARWQKLCATHPEGVTPRMLRDRSEKGAQLPLLLKPERPPELQPP